MSPWARFVDFWIMCELGTTDSIMRNYVARDQWYDTYTNVCSAGSRLGYDIPKGEGAPRFILDETIARLASMGWRNPQATKVRTRLNQWFNYDTIQSGDIRLHSQLSKASKAALKATKTAENPLF